MAKAKGKAASSKKRSGKVASDRMKRVGEEISGEPISIPAPVSDPVTIGALQRAVIAAHRGGTAEQLDAAVKALYDAGDRSLPQMQSTLARWGLR